MRSTCPSFPVLPPSLIARANCFLALFSFVSYTSILCVIGYPPYLSVYLELLEYDCPASNLELHTLPSEKVMKSPSDQTRKRCRNHRRMVPVHQPCS
ncbi:hypothetical protein P170DRAFT_175401 [Aspergillus steynii IBT 23096]|uniref:Uncharacterized protein n=1 Tax=Aspergillus steynii IBT 23096 TaxID=1392250 RepID=A0A2I2G8F1_9EURO|nr:uncharacterized protein P170DRAFT_175401 [Aspergillus steynii IBT 23096]PLB49148.1 hypothetical protein P170DRAFT_175401 [Aspergillus steynii IBT 23096]